MTINDAALFGLTQDHLVSWDPGHFVHTEAQQALTALQQGACDAGFDFKLISSFRPFARQLLIWNNKFNGIRPILDLAGNPVDISHMDDWQICQAILLYSALPGGSRHHWGTDFDFYDGATLAPDYQIQLIEQEYVGDGPFAGLSQWLQRHAASYDFFFPYRDFNGGIASEAWHISYLPLAADFLSQLSCERLSQQIESIQIAGKAAILANLDQVFERYISNISDISKAGDKV